MCKIKNKHISINIFAIAIMFGFMLMAYSCNDQKEYKSLQQPVKEKLYPPGKYHDSCYVVAFEKAAKRGSKFFMKRLANLYLQGQGVKRDYVKAAYWYEKANDREGYLSLCLIAQYYEEGINVPKDSMKAFNLYMKAAKHNVPEAQCILGVYYYSGTAVVPKDVKKAISWFSAAAEQGYEEAKNALDSIQHHQIKKIFNKMYSF